MQSVYTQKLGFAGEMIKFKQALSAFAVVLFQLLLFSYFLYKVMGAKTELRTRPNLLLSNSLSFSNK